MNSSLSEIVEYLKSQYPDQSDSQLEVPARWIFANRDQIVRLDPNVAVYALSITSQIASVKTARESHARKIK